MPRLAANLSMMFNEVPFLDRFDAAAQGRASRRSSSCSPTSTQPPSFASGWTATGLTQVLFNMPPGDWAGGERGLACLPGRQAEFRDGVKQALDYATALDCKLVHCMAGIVAGRRVAGHRGQRLCRQPGLGRRSRRPPPA